MKKKTIILVILACIITILVKNKSENVMIPKETIRIRIISDSNKEADIKEKMEVKEKVSKEIYELLQGVNTIEEAREVITNNLEKLNIVIEDTTNKNYTVNFGKNYFPNKVYKGVIYDEGMYESLVITLGSGSGENWWCVLFPPLCLLEGNEETKDVEYQFFVKELFDKFKS